MIGATTSIVYAALLGAVFGSFANVVIIRFYHAASLWGRSKCPTCHEVIAVKDLIPVISWIVLGGKCRYCKKPIHWQYPLVEAISMILMVIAALRHSPFGHEAATFYLESALALALVIVIVMDLRWKVLPLEIMAAIGVIALALRLGQAWSGGSLLEESYSTGLALAVALAIFGGQWWLSRGRWLGSGDVWFGSMMALVLGWPHTGIAIYLAYIFGGLVVGLLFATGVVRHGMRIPFAPALASGLLAALWFGETFASWLVR